MYVDEAFHHAYGRFSHISSVYRPNLKAKSDADIMRDAKLEAMGLRPDDHEPRRTSQRAQMATDEMVSIWFVPYRICSHWSLRKVMERFKKRMRK